MYVPILMQTHYLECHCEWPARHRSRLPARASQWQAGSGEAGGNKAIPGPDLDYLSGVIEKQAYRDSKSNSIIKLGRALRGVGSPRRRPGRAHRQGDCHALRARNDDVTNFIACVLVTDFLRKEVMRDGKTEDPL